MSNFYNKQNIFEESSTRTLILKTKLKKGHEVKLNPSDTSACDFKSNRIWFFTFINIKLTSRFLSNLR